MNFYELCMKPPPPRVRAEIFYYEGRIRLHLQLLGPNEHPMRQMKLSLKRPKEVVYRAMLRY